ncbi:MAG: prepilin-type N-terminal cleavage/methylation domain-containing protein [Deltaproteobacteria bacterium]|nr:prepilin-type N-terminal cleavage/methylation domain-containing protein [Deltaproteobacteria bacterium]
MMKNKGFTLIELLVVIAIIGILASIAIPQFALYRQRAFASAARADLRNVMTAQEAQYIDTDAYTADAAQLPGFEGISEGVTLNLAVAAVNGEAAQAWSGDSTHPKGTEGNKYCYNSLTDTVLKDAGC